MTAQGSGSLWGTFSSPMRFIPWTVALAVLLQGCNTAGEPMGGPYEGGTTCIAGLVETGPGVFTIDMADTYRGVTRVQTIEDVGLETIEFIQTPEGGGLTAC